MRGTFRGLLGGFAIALALSVPLAAQTVNDLFSLLQKSFAAGDMDSYASVFAPEIRDQESAVVSTFMHLWKMETVIFHRASGGPDVEGDPGLYFQVLYQNGYAAIFEMWHVRLQKTEDRWRIQKKEVTGNITSLYKIRIPSGRVERAGLVEIQHQDIRVTFRDAWVFYDNIPDMETALIVMGKGRVHFSPSNALEKHQVELRYGKDYIDDKLEYAYFRFSDSFFRSNIKITKAPLEMTSSPSPSESSRANSIFSEFYSGSFTIENPLTNDFLSFVPQDNQVVFELRGETTGKLAYIYSPFPGNEIQLIKHDPDQIINFYHPDRPGEDGRPRFISFGEKFDVQRYDLEVDYQPDKFFFSVRARIELRALNDAVDNLMFDFNPGFTIQRISDREGQELFYIQDKRRKLLYVYFVKPLLNDETTTVEVYYQGVLKPSAQTRDIIPAVQFRKIFSDSTFRYDTYLYSHADYWYPASGQDYFQASLKFNIPPQFACIANGKLTEQGKVDSAPGVPAVDKAGNSIFRFETKFPVKYLSFIVGRFDRMAEGNGNDSFDIQGFVSSENPFPSRRGLIGEARSIVRSYEKWFGAFPYEKLYLVDRLWTTDGGHSPASFIVINNLQKPLDAPPQLGTDSPVDLSRYEGFFAAHEIAHQWWGQAVTWESYRDLWLSEGLAQFAAVQYLKAKLGERTYASIIKRFSQWTERKSKWGPITLGPRLGYLDFDAFQAIVYNKSAVALNMLSDLIGEEVFFKGLREFFEKNKYRGARTSGFIRSMEQASGRDLKQFFKGWFDSYLLPEVEVAHDVQKQGNEYLLKFRISQTRDVFVFPLWVKWEENGKEVRQKLEVVAANQKFEFRTASRPAKIKINPDKFVPGDFH